MPQPGIGEQRFDEILAVVERALDRDRMRVGRFDCRHLPALHLGDALMRVENENVDRLAIAARFDRGGAGIARSRADHRDVFAAPGQDRIEHRPDQL